jgi:Tat protein translocase TatB subunit
MTRGRRYVFGPLGGPEIIAIFVLALLLFGPRRLPKLGKTLGRTMSEFRKATSDFKMSLEREIEMEEIRETRDELKKTARDAQGAIRELSDVTALGDSSNEPRPARPGPSDPNAAGGTDAVPRDPAGAAPDKGEGHDPPSRSSDGGHDRHS